MAVLCFLLLLSSLVIVARLVLSWFPLRPGSVLASVNQGLWTITEPILRPLRDLLPPVQVGSMALDLSPALVLLVLMLVSSVICR